MIIHYTMLFSAPVARSGIGRSSLTSLYLTVPANGACLSFYYLIDQDISTDFIVELITEG